MCDQNISTLNFLLSQYIQQLVHFAPFKMCPLQHHILSLGVVPFFKASMEDLYFDHHKCTVIFYIKTVPKFRIFGRHHPIFKFQCDTIQCELWTVSLSKTCK